MNYNLMTKLKYRLKREQYRIRTFAKSRRTFSVENVWVGPMLNKQNNHGEMPLPSGPVHRSRTKLTTDGVDKSTYRYHINNYYNESIH